MIKLLIYAAEDFVPIIEESLRVDPFADLNSHIQIAEADLVLVQDKNNHDCYAVLKNRVGESQVYIHSSDVAKYATNQVNITVYPSPTLISPVTKVEMEKIVREEITHPLQRMEV